MNKKRVMICSGGFDPLHSGHIQMFKDAKSKCDWLVVCINSDAWLKKKKGINFLEYSERVDIIKAIKYIDEVVLFEDDESGSAVNGLKKVISNEQFYKNKFKNVTYLDHGEIYMEDTETEIEFIFVNGGDRNKKSTPSLEQKYCEENGILLEWSVGGNKFNSSSWILNRYRDWHFEMTERAWGKFFVIYKDLFKKVKIIEIEPKKSISLQYHNHRSEHWVVSEGIATVYIETDKYKHEETVNKNESIYVPIGAKHKITNNSDNILQIVEVQLGDIVEETDIVRLD